MHHLPHVPFARYTKANPVSYFNHTDFSVTNPGFLHIGEGTLKLLRDCYVTCTCGSLNHHVSNFKTTICISGNKILD